MAESLNPTALRQRGRWLAAAVLALLLLGQATERLPGQTRVRAVLFDTYQSFAPRERVSAPVVIVDIDEASLARHGQWPWPRSLLARLVDGLQAAGPAALGLDILMPEPDRASPCAVTRLVPGIANDLLERVCQLPDNDAQLARALRASRAVLGVAGVERPDPQPLQAPPHLAVGGDARGLLRRFPGSLTSVPVLHAAAAGHALLSADPESGILRRVPLAAAVGEAVMPTLAIEILRLASHSPAFSIHRAGDAIRAVGVADRLVPTQPDASLWVHYGRLQPERYVSASAVLAGTVPADRFKDRVVLVGVSGLGLVDFPVTALRERVPGVEVHAQVIESIFDGTTLWRPSWAGLAELAVTLVAGLAVITTIARAGSMVLALAVLAGTAALFGAGLGLFVWRQWLLDAATPAALTLLLFGGLLTWELMRAQIERRALADSLRAQREAAARTAGELAAARRIQLGMVPDPRQVFAREPRLDLAARMEPAREVGGDLYDCFRLDAHRVFFLVGDVCGKGIPASLFMATSKTLCKSVALRADLPLDEVLAQANREIERDNPEMLFVTLLAGVLDLRDGTLWIASAGHEPPLVVSPGCDPQALAASPGPPLGIDADARYPIARHTLAPGDFLCVCSDGVAEATNAPGDFFGRARHEDALRRAAGTPDADSDTVLRTLIDDIARFAQGAEPADDITVLVLRRRVPA